MKQEKKNDVAVLLEYAGSRRGLTFLGLALSAVSMLLRMAPYICIWLAARDLIEAAPEWTQAQNVSKYGWIAFAFAVSGIILYFAGLMCTHLAAFRTASNIRKQGVAHVMKAPLGFFDSNASGLIRGRLDAAAADTETLLAHNLADIVGTIVLFLSMLVMMFLFDWRMGAACLLAAVISVIAMFSMMGGKNAKLMAEYQAAQDRMTKAGTEYVRGIPVVKIFQQTVLVQGVSGGYRRLQQQSRTLSGGCMPCSSVCQFNLYRRSVRVSGSSGAVPCSRRTGKRQFCWLCCRFRFLCRIFSHHFHCACKNNVCFLRYDVGQYRFGTDQSGDGGAYPGSTQSPTVPS